MKVENLEPIVRMMVRERALGLDYSDIAAAHPEYDELQVAKICQGATFKRAVKEMQEQIDQELIEHAAQDPVKQFLHSKGLSAAHRLAALAENHDGETPHAVQKSAADSLLDRGGYGAPKENVVIPILMLSPAKLDAVQGLKKADGVIEMPDYVDGHTQRLVT